MYKWGIRFSVVSFFVVGVGSLWEVPHICHRVCNLLANMQQYRPLPDAVRPRTKFYEGVRLRTRFYEAVRLGTKFNRSKSDLA